jgi:Cof subfamily protein (haloacid dehalogenase superfamily)
MIKALFFDIDGTLVSFKTHIIPQSTVDAIAEAKKNGVRIYISTGRPISLITNLGQIEHLIDGYITTNGAYCFVDDETGRHTICCNDIPTEDIQMMLNAASKWDRPVIVVGQQDIAIYNYKDVVDDVFHKGLGVDNLDYDKPIEDVLIQPVLQMTPFISEEQEVELMSKMKNTTSGRWCPDFTDITCKAADKGKGLLAMAEHEGLAVADTMAFGDGGNDISIIKQAGIGVAMGNAGDEVKKNADFITTSVDEDGIMNALIKFGVI